MEANPPVVRARLPRVRLGAGHGVAVMFLALVLLGSTEVEVSHHVVRLQLDGFTVCSNSLV